MRLISKRHFWIYIYLFQTEFLFKIYDKPNDFDFDIVNFLYFPRSASYGFITSQLFLFARMSSHVTDFNARNKISTDKLLQQGYRYNKLRKTLS